MPAWAKNNLVVLIAGVAAGVLFVVGWALALRFLPYVAVALVVATAAIGWAIFRLWTRRTVTVLDRWPRGKLSVSMLAGAVVVGLLIQAVPYGRDHTNPPVSAEPAWDSSQTRDLAELACFGCHSNEVDYPWYADFAPSSWAVQFHIDRGRDKVNFSEWDRPQRDAEESAETVRDGSMPPAYYLVTHPEARLTDAEKAELAAGLAATIGEDD